MKLLFASDLHGSAYYAEKLEELIRNEAPDKTVLLGDLLYHGPRNDLPREYDSKKVTAILNGLKTQVLAVRGNCDAEVDQMVLEFPIMADYMALFLEGRMVFVTHGHLFNEENLPNFNPGDVLIHGHTHVRAAADRGAYCTPEAWRVQKATAFTAIWCMRTACSPRRIWTARCWKRWTSGADPWKRR